MLVDFFVWKIYFVALNQIKERKKWFVRTISEHLNKTGTFDLYLNFKVITESSLSSWCKNWARSSGVVPSMPWSWRYWIPLFGFLLKLRIKEGNLLLMLRFVEGIKTSCLDERSLLTGRCLARWSLSAAWGLRTAQGCRFLTSGCCSFLFRTRLWSPGSWCSRSGLWSLEPSSLCSPAPMVSPGLRSRTYTIFDCYCFRNPLWITMEVKICHTNSVGKVRIES